MIDITDCTDRCCNYRLGQCNVLSVAMDEAKCNNTCPFYKPMGCKDWVRVERDGRTMLYMPEEYERSFKRYEKDDGKAKLYWRIKSVPIRKA